MAKKLTVTIDNLQMKKLLSSIIKEKVSNRDKIIEFLNNLLFDGYQTAEPFILLCLNCNHDIFLAKGDMVQVDRDQLYFSALDDEATSRRGYCEGSWFNAVVEDVYPHKTDCYRLTVKYVSTDGSEKTQGFSVSAASIRKDGIIPHKNNINLGDLL